MIVHNNSDNIGIEFFNQSEMAGNDPAQEPGVLLNVWADDGSPEWLELYARAQQGPVRSGH